MDTVFETQRLRIRPWRESDVEALFRYASEPEVGERAGWPPHKSIAESIEVIREVFSNGHTWALELKETGEVIGCIGYYDWKESNIRIGEQEAEIGYWLGKPVSFRKVLQKSQKVYSRKRLKKEIPSD